MAGRIGLRETDVHIRVSRIDRDIIDRAAKISGQSRSEFWVHGARRAAEEVLRDQRIFHLGAGAWNDFVAALDGPSSDGEQLKTLSLRRAPWEK